MPRATTRPNHHAREAPVALGGFEQKYDDHPQEFSRLAAVQIALVVYSILFTGVCLKMRSGLVPPEAFAFQIRDNGFLLLLVPVVWGIWAALSSNRRDTDVQQHSMVLGVGVVLSVALFLVACAATDSALAFYPDLPPADRKSEPIISRRVPELP